MTEKVAAALAGNAGLALGVAGLTALLLDKAGLVKLPQFGGTVISPTFTDSAAPSFSPSFSPSFAPVIENRPAFEFIAPMGLPSPPGPAPPPASPSAPPDSTPGQSGPARAGTLTKAEFAALVGGDAEAKRLRDRYKKNRHRTWDNLGNGKERWAYAVANGLIPGDYQPPPPPDPSPPDPAPAPSGGDPFAFPNEPRPVDRAFAFPWVPSPTGGIGAVIEGTRAEFGNTGRPGQYAGPAGGVAGAAGHQLVKAVVVGTGAFVLDAVPSFLTGRRVATTEALFRSGQRTREAIEAHDWRWWAAPFGEVR